MKNLQGDVIAITDRSGLVVARYSYDAWGVCTVEQDSAYCIGGINPYRYRGYYYDSEIGMYYLQSRYYNPTVGRFVNADETTCLGTSGTILGYNLFLYCFNNVVNLCDPYGYAPTYSFGQRYDLGHSWYARFDRGVVGNKDHVHIWNGQKEYVFTLEGEVSHENKTGSGMPPSKQLKNLKEKTGFDLEKKRADYVKKNKKSISEDGCVYLPDGTIIRYGSGPYRLMGIQYYPVNTRSQAFYGSPHFIPNFMIPAVNPIIAPAPLPAFYFWSTPILIG